MSRALAFTIAGAAIALFLYVTTSPAGLLRDLWDTADSAAWLLIGLTWRRRGR